MTKRTGRIHGNTIHGGRRNRRATPEYTVWCGMIQRCTNPKAPNFATYGGAGLKVCDRWRSFENFLADMGPRPIGKTLDRIDNAHGYEPGNCRWATSDEQRRNRRISVKLTYQEREWFLADFAKRFGLKESTVRSRVKHGWTIERIATTPALTPQQCGATRYSLDLRRGRK